MSVILVVFPAAPKVSEEAIKEVTLNFTSTMRGFVRPYYCTSYVKSLLFFSFLSLFLFRNRPCRTRVSDCVKR